MRQAAESVSGAGDEIATGNLDLSRRTEQTASNLQAAAHELTDLTERVRVAADSASQANEVASAATAVAVRGGEVVSQVVSTIINASSKRIADILSVIDGVAFQTNILALNAAVEAARAGDQGRGFAVVASVRALAVRSAAAAKEINALIETSVQRVELGARQVAEAGSTMNEVVGAVDRVSDPISKLSHAAADQSNSVTRVHESIGRLEQATQQNGALVEQSAAAADSLPDQSRRLNSMVASFRL